jgi:hypothetical protein
LNHSGPITAATKQYQLKSIGASTANILAQTADNADPEAGIHGGGCVLFGAANDRDIDRAPCEPHVCGIAEEKINEVILQGTSFTTNATVINPRKALEIAYDLLGNSDQKQYRDQYAQVNYKYCCRRLLSRSDSFFNASIC